MVRAIDRYNDAVEIETYIDNMENNRDQFIENIEAIDVRPEHREFFSQEPFRFLIITEDWCIDSLQFIPALVKLSRDVPTMEIRVLRRDEHTDLATNYRRKDGYQAIPVIIALDEDGNELGAIVERPEKATVEMAEETRQFQENNPDLPGIKRNVDRMPEETRAQVKAHSREWRVGQLKPWAGYLFEELSEIIEEGRQARAA